MGVAGWQNVMPMFTLFSPCASSGCSSTASSVPCTCGCSAQRVHGQRGAAEAAETSVPAFADDGWRRRRRHQSCEEVQPAYVMTCRHKTQNTKRAQLRRCNTAHAMSVLTCSRHKQEGSCLAPRRATYVINDRHKAARVPLGGNADEVVAILDDGCKRQGQAIWCCLQGHARCLDLLTTHPVPDHSRSSSSASSSEPSMS